MARKRQNSDNGNLEPQRSSAAEFLTYVAAKGLTNEQFEIRYEDESIWMSQKMLAAVYGVEVPNIAYHLRRIFEDAELSEETSIKEILIDVGDGRKFAVSNFESQFGIIYAFPGIETRMCQAGYKREPSVLQWGVAGASPESGRR